MFEQAYEPTIEVHHKQQHSYPPNNTIYIQNINEKVPVDELKDTLFNVFEEFGEIIDIVAKRNIRMRGQAFIIFRDINSAMQACRKVNNRDLYGKTMKISFARQKSDAIAKIDGTFHIRQRPEDYFHKKFQQKFIKRSQQQKSKVRHEKNLSRKIQNPNNLPNHILFCQGLDQTITAEMLKQYFMRFPGFVDIRLAPKNYAFVEYEDQFKAGTALSALNENKVGEVTLRLSYAKK